MRSQSLLMVVSLLGLALAGCSGGADPETESVDDDVEVTVGDATGGIKGLVTTEDLVPLEGAQVQLRELSDSLIETNSAGEFGYSELEPGEYMIDVARLGYKATAIRIQVVPGAVAEAPIQLQQLPSATPFADWDSATGKVRLSVGWNFGDCAVRGITCNALVSSGEGYQTEHEWVVDEVEGLEIETVIVEVEWVATTTVCKSEFLFDALMPGIQRGDLGGTDPDDPKGWAADSKTSPIYLRIDRAQMEERGVYDDVHGEWATRAFASESGTTNVEGNDAGCSQEQAFDVYWTVFYGAAAPEGFSQRPDA